MALLFESLRGGTVIKLTVAPTPVSDVVVIKRFIAFDHNVFVFRVGNLWEGYIYKYFTGVAVILDSSQMSEPTV